METSSSSIPPAPPVKTQEQLLAHLSDVTTRMSQLQAKQEIQSGDGSVAAAVITQALAGAAGETLSSSSTSSNSHGPPPTPADINRMLGHLGQNPEMMGDVMNKIPNVISPDMIDQVKKMFPGGVQGQNAEKMLAQLTQNGLDPQTMRSQMVQKQNKAKGMVAHNDKTQTVIILTIQKQLKVREFLKNDMMEAASVNLKVATEGLKDIDCGMMCQSIFKNKQVRIFYNPHDKTVNKRAKKLVGFPIGGDVIFYLVDENLTEADFLAVEKYMTDN